MKKWTVENLRKEALKYKTRESFRRGNKSAYNSSMKLGIYTEITVHMPRYVDRKGKNHSQFKWNTESIQKEALKYGTVAEFEKNSRGAYKAALKLNILDTMCSHLVYVRKYWTFQELNLEALKYTTRGQFKKNNLSAYQSARNSKALDQICSHMPRRTDQSGKNSGTFKWTYEMIKEEVLKYRTRLDFARGNPAAYQVAQKRNLLDEICSHMKRPSNTSKPEKELIDVIKTDFPTARTLRDCKIKIEDKPFIHGFHIDIFVEELSLGIEFDGKYHHTFEYMRKDKAKKNWPDEALRQYHEIKDTYFLSKGIKILHIKEEDWIASKQACIDKCLIFLASGGLSRTA